MAAAALVDQLKRDHIGKLVRGIDAVAKLNGGKGPVHKKANDYLGKFFGTLKRMREGEQ